MCLIIVLEAPGLSRREAGAVSRGLRQQPLFGLYVQRMPREAKGSSFLVGIGTEMCACGLMHKSADTSARELALNSKSAPVLETVLKYFSEQVGNGAFSVRASWHGEAREVHRPRTERVATLDTLLEDIRAGRIGNNVTYQIKGMSPNPPLQPTGRRTAGG